MPNITEKSKFSKSTIHEPRPFHVYELYLLSAYNLTILTAFLLTDLLVLHLNPRPGRTKASQTRTFSPGYRSPQLVLAVDYNPLFLFLVANIATGISTSS